MADVFSKSIDGLLDAKIKGISTSEKKFMSGWDKIEKHIFRRVVDYTRKMKSTGGVLDFDENNVDHVNALNKTVLDAINSSDYPDKVKEYLRDFDVIKKNNIDIHKSVNNLSGSELEKLINPVQKQMVDQTVTGLTGSGIDTEFIQPMKEGIMKNIVAGATITELESFIDQFIISNPARLGRLTNYSQQIARDTLNQYDGQINSRIAAEFGLNAGRYVGSLIDDSRPQCVRWVGKGVLLFEDLEKEINWANNNGSGMIPGTNPANFATYRGGYNCRHSFIPFKMTKSQRAEYEQEQKAKANPEPAPVTPTPAQKPPAEPKKQTKPKPVKSTVVSKIESQLAANSAKTKILPPDMTTEEIQRESLLSWIEETNPKVAKDFRDSNTPLDKIWMKFSSYSDTQVTPTGMVGRLVGYDGKPLMVSKNEFDELVASGKFIEMNRGLASTGQILAQKAISDFKTGPLFNGRGIYGDGTYFDWNKGPDGKFNVAIEYANGNEKNVFRALLPKDAKIVDAIVMEDVFDELVEKFGNSIADLDQFKKDLPNDVFNNLVKIRDSGINIRGNTVSGLASRIGVDALSYVPPKGGRKYMVVLNRTKIIVD